MRPSKPDRLFGRHVERLHRARRLLAEKRYDADDTILTRYGAPGFEPDLPAAFPDDEMQTIALPQLHEAR